MGASSDKFQKSYCCCDGGGFNSFAFIFGFAHSVERTRCKNSSLERPDLVSL